jgi:SAM-dependent methyltransferase
MSFYRSDDEHNHVKLDMFPADNVWHLSRGRGIGRFVADHVSPDLSGSTPRILEVGAGFGYNLWALREQFPNAEIVACEPDPICKPFLEKLGAGIIPFMADLDIITKLAKEKPFDIVVMSHVLEHLLNPVEIIKALLGLLNTNGFIVIEVPCCMTSLRNWNVEPHVSFFNLESLGNCIEQSGGVPKDMNTCGPVIDSASRSLTGQTIISIGKKLLPATVKKSIRNLLGRPDLSDKFDADTLLEKKELIPVKAFNEYGGDNRVCIRTLVQRKTEH